MKFKSKPKIIEAYQFEYFHYPNGKWMISNKIPGVREARTLTEKIKDWWNGFPSYYVDTLEGTSYALKNGDWVIKGIKGEYYPCKPDIFEKSYEIMKGI